MPTRGNLTMVQKPKQQSPSPWRFTVRSKTGFSAGVGDARCGVIVLPAIFHGCCVLGCPQGAFIPPVHPGINSTQNKMMLRSPRTKSGRCVSRSFTGAHYGAFGCKGSQATHHLGQKALQGPGIPTLHQNDSSHLDTAATGISTTKPRWFQSVCFARPARPRASSPSLKPSQFSSS